MSKKDFIEEARSIIISMRRDLAQEETTVDEIISKSIELAGMLLSAVNLEKTNKESLQQTELSKMMDDQRGKIFTTAMTDQSFRSAQNERVANQISYLLDQYGVPTYLSLLKKRSLNFFKKFGVWVPWVFVPLTRFFLRNETSLLILPGEEKALNRHIQIRQREGVRVNLNHLGEAILGEEEAKARLNIYLKDLENPLIDYISIKVSTLYSQINLLATDATLQIVSEKFRSLLRAASPGKKFINLDMEEYRDLILTYTLFIKVLSEQEFKNQSAGIVLQAYLPDSFSIQEALTKWAKKRVVEGGAPVKIRIVKGANLSMEKVEASLKGWPQAPYVDKADVDANFKLMIDYALQKENAEAVFVGIGSHNIFDISYGMLLASKNKTEAYVTFEMLEGMADPLRRVVQKLNQSTLLYCPAAKNEEFQTAVAYLVRRLDENTAEENFLRHSFNLTVDSVDFANEALKFSQACIGKSEVKSYSRRGQNRFNFIPRPLHSCFLNEPDTDLSLPENQKWALDVLNKWKNHFIAPLPLLIDGKEIIKNFHPGFDPSFPNKTQFQYASAEIEDLEEALKGAVKATERFNLWGVKKRSDLLKNAANYLREGRADLIGAMILNTGKIFFEADVEVSEAIDFADYYAANLQEIEKYTDVNFSSKGPVLVLSPWNFPVSIPAGGIFAGLATGSPVLFKPAPEAILPAFVLVDLLWKAGVPKEFLQFIPCREDPEGSYLVKDNRIKTILLTGSTETAKKLNQLHSGFKLLAETGGKNAIIVSNMSDRDLAVKDIVQSAFGHAGQKCSACSLVILLEEVYQDPKFLGQLKDAAASLRTASPWDPAAKVNPLISKPSQQLRKAIEELEPGEEWLLKPEIDPLNPQLISPGIKLNVKPGSFMHLTELFGPVLSVMSAPDLKTAISYANQVSYGLTSGIHSLDKREIDFWRQNIIAGNLYINRGITGAIVERQPFGGTKESQFGLGAKAGGANYISQLLNKLQKELPQENESSSDLILKDYEGIENRELFYASIKSYHYFFDNYFSRVIDPVKLIGQDNLTYFVPHDKIYLRVASSDKYRDVHRIIEACKITNTPLEVSLRDGLTPYKTDAGWVIESEEAFINRLKQLKFRPRVRLIAEPSLALERGLKELNANVHLAEVMANGRFELLHYLREVSLSYDYHRYGNLGDREHELRAPLMSSPYDVELTQGLPS